MTDERMKRLERMAQLAFGRPCEVAMLDDGCVEVVDKKDWLLASVASHPRALDALEAALKVLTTEMAS